LWSQEEPRGRPACLVTGPKGLGSEVTDIDPVQLSQDRPEYNDESEEAAKGAEEKTTRQQLSLMNEAASSASASPAAVTLS